MKTQYIKNESPLTAGQLIDALYAGETIIRKTDFGENTLIKKEGTVINCYGWGSAYGIGFDRIESIIENPENFFIEREDFTMPENERIIDFINWLNNNWFIPTSDGFWKLDEGNIEFKRTIPQDGSSIFSADDLLKLFINNNGEY